METALRRMAETLDATFDAIGGWLADGAAVPLLEPAQWPLGLWLLLLALMVLLLIASMRRRSRGPLQVRAPEILVTQAELVPEQRTGRVGAGSLTMTVTNLGRYPVQLLEAASSTGGGRVGVAEIVVLVPPMAEIEVALRLPVGKLDDGVLDLYCYAAATRTKTWRHRAELTWEPWAKRFKVAPLEQRIEPVRALASARRDVVRMDDVARAEEVAARQTETASRHTDPGVRRTQPGTRRRELEATDQRRLREPAPGADAPAARPGSLVALLGTSRTRPVQPPPETNGGGTGSAARAGRSTSAGRAAAAAEEAARTRAAASEPAREPAREPSRERARERGAARPNGGGPGAGTPPPPVPAKLPSTVPAANAGAPRDAATTSERRATASPARAAARALFPESERAAAALPEPASSASARPTTPVPRPSGSTAAGTSRPPAESTPGNTAPGSADRKAAAAPKPADGETPAAVEPSPPAERPGRRVPVPPRPVVARPVVPAKQADDARKGVEDDDPDEPRAPRRPPGRTLEFPDEF